MAPTTIHIAANFTAEPVEGALRFWGDQLGWELDLGFAPFDQVFQELLDPSSGLRRNSRGLNVLLLKLDRWLPQDAPGSSGEVLARLVDDLVAAARTALDHGASGLLVVLCPDTGTEHAGLLAAAADRLRAGLAGGAVVRLLTADEVFAAYPVAEWSDPAADLLGQVPYSEEFFAALGTCIARHEVARTRSPYKVLVLDCDNTIWRGILGELGPEGVVFDDTMIAFQRFVVQQVEAGMLVCLASKNNLPLVEEVFRTRTEMPLKWEHVVNHRINWAPKSQNIEEMLSELNLGLDSVIFLDDSPFEISEVSSHLPQVLAIQFPTESEAILRLTRQCWAFDRLAITAEDRHRTEAYREQVGRDAVRRQATSVEDFLRDLQLEIGITPLAAEDLPRASQMTQRTNQMNATTIRRSEAEILAACDGGGLSCRTVRVRDRFGDYGLVGLMLFAEGPESVVVDTLLLSCRALGRRVEQRMLAHLGEFAASRGLGMVEIPFRPTARNVPMRAFLDGLGVPSIEEGEGRRYRVPVEWAVDAVARAGSAVPDAPPEEGRTEATAPASAPSSAPKDLHQRILSEFPDVRAIQAAIVAARHHARPELDQAVVAPRDPLETTIATIWKRALHLDQVGIHDNYFDLGGTSLVAVTMFASLEKHTGVTLQPTVLFQAPTIAQLATEISARRAAATPGESADRSLVPVQPAGERRPLFCVHAGAGTILFYYPLARALGNDQPLYALQARGVNGHSAPHATLDEMAASYIQEIRKVQPQGPYQLAGFCLGAILAFEMAQQLTSDGERVSFLGSFDGPAPRYSIELGRVTRDKVVAKRDVLPAWARPFPREIIRSMFFHLDSIGQLAFADQLAYFPRKTWGFLQRKGQRIRNRAVGRYLRRRGGPVPMLFRRFSWYMAVNNMFAKSRYVPHKYPGDITVFTAKGRYPDPHLGWVNWVTGRVDVVEVPGDLRHHRALMDEPMVSALVTALRPYLDHPGATPPPAPRTARDTVPSAR